MPRPASHGSRCRHWRQQRRQRSAPVWPVRRRRTVLQELVKRLDQKWRWRGGWPAAQSAAAMTAYRTSQQRGLRRQVNTPTICENLLIKWQGQPLLRYETANPEHWRSKEKPRLLCRRESWMCDRETRSNERLTMKKPGGTRGAEQQHVAAARLSQCATDQTLGHSPGLRETQHIRDVGR